MSKSYKVNKSFWLGELNKELKINSEIMYDESLSSITIGAQTYEVKNIKAAIKAGWLVPKDGILPKLEGPVGETEEEASDRRRKERFAELAKKEKEQLAVDQREIVRFGGCIRDDNSELFAKALNLEPASTHRVKFSGVVLEEDAKVVKTGVMSVENKEVQDLKSALGQNKTDKIAPKDFEIFKDQYDADVVEVSKYTDFNKENTMQNWGTLHWTKKAEVIEKADKKFLEKLKKIESSDKIVERINKRIQIL